MSRSTLKFVCPTCGRVTDQTKATAVDETTYVVCHNYTQHKNNRTRIMKVQRDG